MGQKKNENSPFKLVGEISTLVHRQDKAIWKFWNKILKFLHRSRIISRKSMMDWYARGRLVRSDYGKNIIANAGFNVLAQILCGEYGDTGAITEMALGDGVGSPSVGDTALFNEVYRNSTASSTSSSSIAICTAFFTEDEVDGTFTEFGNFIDDTELWSHINVSWSKSDSETLTVQCKYTLSNTA